MSEFIDLHTHSTASDGSLSPAQLVRYGAEKQGLKAIALTDHDTLSGLHEALEEGKKTGLRVIPGIEITTVVDGCDVHILGLMIDPDDERLKEKMAHFAQSRHERNLGMIQKLEEAGVDIHLSDFAQFGAREISRNHFAKLLVQKGYAKDRQDANIRYMLPGGICYVMRRTPSYQECLEVIHQAGGLAFVAHINQIDRKDPERCVSICRRILEAGADGLETRYCEYDDFWEETALGLAREYGLLSSGGSDFHGSFKPGIDLMTGYGSLAVPEEYLQAMDRAYQERF